MAHGHSRNYTTLTDATHSKTISAVRPSIIPGANMCALIWRHSSNSMENAILQNGRMRSDMNGKKEPQMQTDHARVTY